MNEFSHLKNKVCIGRGLFPHFMLEVNEVGDLYAIRAYTYSGNNGIKIFRAVKDKEEMKKFKLGNEREYQLFIKRAFGE